MNDRVQIRKLTSGVPGLDEVLGGGIPEFSFNLIAGGPGGGKTTMAHQIMFANATPERKAVYFSIIGEPPIKMLRYQQQYDFFDADQGGRRLDSFRQPRPAGARRWDGEGPGRHRAGGASSRARGSSFVDSFRAMVRERARRADRRASSELTSFMQRLALDAHQLRGHHLPDRRVRDGERRQRGVHRGRRARLALPGRRAQLRRAQAAGAEDARAGADPWAAHRAHRGRGLQRVPPPSQAAGGRSPSARSNIASRPGCRVSTR